MGSNVSDPKGQKVEIKKLPNGRYGAFDELSKRTGQPGATSGSKSKLERFIKGK